jgi:hypothetical protein
LFDVLSPALIFALAAVSLAGPSHRVIEFAGGRTTVDSLGDADHVLVQDKKGNTTSESWCNSARFGDYFVLFIRLKDAVMGGENDAVLGLVDYPLRVNDPKRPLLLKTAASLSKNYSKVFTAQVQQRIRTAEPAALFCKDGQAMLGDGVIWANRSGVAVLNADPPATNDLVLMGEVTWLNRRGGDPSKEWIVTVRIKTVITGEFSGKTFQFAVHSPAQSGLKKGRSYKIEAVWTGDGYAVDQLQWTKPTRVRQDAATAPP